MFSSSGIDVLLRWLAVDGPDPAAGTMLLANNCCGKSRFGAQLLVGDRPASLGAPHQQIFVEARKRAGNRGSGVRDTIAQPAGTLWNRGRSPAFVPRYLLRR